MRSRAKIDRLAHKYALDISKFHEKTEIKIDFNNLNKDFYDDIELNDNKIKSNKKLLNKIKDLTLKEFVYTNKIIPDIWKNKFNYQHDMTNLISKDKNLISYIGSFPLKSQLNQKLPKINSKTEINLMKNTYNKSKKSFRFKPKNDYGDDHAKLIMEDYKVAYPIKEKMENLMIDYSNNLKNFEDSKDNNKILNDNDMTSTNKSINSKDSKTNSLLQKINLYNKIEKLKIQRSFRQNIFSIDKLKKNDDNKDNKSKISFLDSKTRKHKNSSKIFEIKNKNIEKNIKSINYYGPHFSFCSLCKIKNMDFYNRMEPNQCLELINHIKNIKKGYNANKNNKITNNRSSSVPRLSLFNDQNSKDSEIEDNTYKVDF